MADKKWISDHVERIEFNVTVITGDDGAILESSNKHLIRCFLEAIAFEDSSITIYQREIRPSLGNTLWERTSLKEMLV